MKTLDRYILRNFFFALVIFTTCLVGLYVAADAMFQVKNFSQGDEFNWNEFLNHYVLTGPQIIYRLAPFLVLMSAMFTVTRMSRLGELIPVRAAGISLFRLTAPLFAIAFIIGLGIFIGQEMIVPVITESVESSAAGKGIQPEIINDSFGNSFTAKWYNIKAKRLGDFFLYRQDENGREYMKAKNAVFTHKDGKKGWLLKKGKIFEYDKSGNLVVQLG